MEASSALHINKICLLAYLCEAFEDVSSIQAMHNNQSLYTRSKAIKAERK